VTRKAAKKDNIEPNDERQTQRLHPISPDPFLRSKIGVSDIEEQAIKWSLQGIVYATNKETKKHDGTQHENT
jgi:hypothetical protein